MAASIQSPLVKEWPEQGQWSYDDWARLPDDGTRYEVIDGALYMTPPPSLAHQAASGELHYAMKNFIDAHNLGYLYAAPVGVRLPNQPIVFQPDLVFVSRERGEIRGRAGIEGTPDLVVEILSPANWPYDRNEKFRLYQEAGVPEYWIVDYRARTVEVLVLEEGEYALLGKWGAEESATSHVLAGFELPVARVFRNL
jgi:Uma2 family endonuclease